MRALLHALVGVMDQDELAMGRAEFAMARVEFAMDLPVYLDHHATAAHRVELDECACSELQLRLHCHQRPTQPEQLGWSTTLERLSQLKILQSRPLE